MNAYECADYVEATLSALRTGFETKRVDGSCRIYTPLLRRDGDSFVLHVQLVGDAVEISDDGATMDYLEMSGVKTRRNRAFERLVGEVLRAHYVELLEGRLVSYASTLAEAGIAAPRLLAAMNDISQYELTRRERAPTSFPQQVEAELVGLSVPYDKGATLRGSIRDRSFQFFANGRRNLILEPLQANTSARASQVADVLIVSVEDVWQEMPRVGAVAILDDSRQVWQPALADLAGFGINVVMWSQRHDTLWGALEDPRRGRVRR